MWGTLIALLAIGTSQSLSLVGDQRLSSLERHLVTVARDPAYQRGMRYEAWSLADVLALLPEARVQALRDDVAITFVASDGYRAIRDLSAIWKARQRGYIAFRDLQAGARKWKPIRAGKSVVTPAPFYLVWTGAKDPDLPWPYQLVGIELATLDRVFAHAFP